MIAVERNLKHIWRNPILWEVVMSTRKFFSLALAAGLIAGTIAAESSWAAPARGRRLYSYQPRAAASTPARVQSNRRYSYSPGAYSNSANGGTLGLRSTYRPGPGYSPRQGVNSAAWKVLGL